MHRVEQLAPAHVLSVLSVRQGADKVHCRCLGRKTQNMKTGLRETKWCVTGHTAKGKDA